jgi:hypothetical protein
MPWRLSDIIPAPARKRYVAEPRVRPAVTQAASPGIKERRSIDAAHEQRGGHDSRLPGEYDARTGAVPSSTCSLHVLSPARRDQLRRWADASRAISVTQRRGTPRRGQHRVGWGSTGRRLRRERRWCRRLLAVPWSRSRRARRQPGGEVSYLWYGEESREVPWSTTIPDALVTPRGCDPARERPGDSGRQPLAHQHRRPLRWYRLGIALAGRIKKRWLNANTQRDRATSEHAETVMPDRQRAGAAEAN